MIILFFALIDLLAGISILNSSFFSVIVLYVAYALLIKGGFSLFGSIFSGNFFDWMGVVDVIGGIVLFLINSHITFGFFAAIGWVLIGKSIYTFIRWLFQI